MVAKKEGGVAIEMEGSVYLTEPELQLGSKEVGGALGIAADKVADTRKKVGGADTPIAQSVVETESVGDRHSLKRQPAELPEKSRSECTTTAAAESEEELALQALDVGLQPVSTGEWEPGGTRIEGDGLDSRLKEAQAGIDTADTESPAVGFESEEGATGCGQPIRDPMLGGAQGGMELKAEVSIGINLLQVRARERIAICESLVRGRGAGMMELDNLSLRRIDGHTDPCAERI